VTSDSPHEEGRRGPRRWSDRDWSHDELLTHLTIYGATETIGSSMRLYLESARNPGRGWGRVEQPVAMLQFPGDMFPTPREWVERDFNVARWTEADAGEHFPEQEHPAVVAADLRALRAPGRRPRPSVVVAPALHSNLSAGRRGTGAAGATPSSVRRRSRSSIRRVSS